MNCDSQDNKHEKARIEVIESLSRGYACFNPYGVGGLLKEIWNLNVPVAQDIKKKLLDEFWHLHTANNHGYDVVDRGMHASYYVAASGIAKELGDIAKVDFFNKRWRFARSSERDGEIADYMMDSMWGL